VKQSPKNLKHWLPILEWLPNYNRGWLRPDFLAGLIIMALLAPETAFYAAPIGRLLYAIFGTSRQLVVAVSAAVAVMSASIVAGLAPAGSTEFLALTAALATAGSQRRNDGNRGGKFLPARNRMSN